jgi:hypothetical protein
MGQAWDIIRRLRAISPSTDGTMGSVARAAGASTQRQPALTSVNGSLRSCPMTGSTST